MPRMVMPKLLLTMLLLMPPILLTMMMYPHSPKNPHIYLETVIMSTMLLMMMLHYPMILPPPTLSYILNLNVKLTPGQ